MPCVNNRACHALCLAGVGAGAMLATPGPGSVLFQSATSWQLRLGGGMGLGAATAVLCFAISCHPAATPYLQYLPEGMQPAKGAANSQAEPGAA